MRVAAVSGAVLVILAVMPLGMLWMLRSPPQVGGQTSPDDLGLSFQHERLTTSDGVELDAWVIEARNDTDSAIVIGHGYPASKGDVLPALAFLAEDHHLVFIDHRGLGESDGQTTLGVEEPLDIQAGIERALRIDGVEHVGLAGFSMGGAAVLQAAHDDRVDAVMAQAAYADLDSLAPRVFDGLGPLAGPLGSLLLTYAAATGPDPDQARPVESIREIDVPILLIHGEADQTVPVDHAHRLADAQPNATLWIIEGAHHGQVAIHPDYDQRVGGFFAEHLS